MIEFEMKFKVSHSLVKEKLIENNASFIRIENHEDTYYQHPSRDFRETDEAFRVRSKDNSLSLTYKGPKFNSESKSRQEIDVKVQSDEIHELLKSLGFEYSGSVKKVREIWKHRDLTITLDLVENLGEYIELEVIGRNKAQLEKILSKMRKLILDFGLDPEDQIPESYLELLYPSLG